MSRDSDRLFSHLAPGYDTHFVVAHRRAYDQLAWELTLGELPPAPATVLDVGCGVGRWAGRLSDLGYTMLGIEPSEGMATRVAAARPRMRLIRADVEDTRLPTASVDAVVAMGSLQYANDSRLAFANIARWLRPGGCACVLVDSRIALGAELARAGRVEEALARIDSRTGRWTVDEIGAELRLYDTESLGAELSDAGLEVGWTRGLLVGATIWGREEVMRRLEETWSDHLGVERHLSERQELADLGKQLLAVARKPAH